MELTAVHRDLTDRIAEKAQAEYELDEEVSSAIKITFIRSGG